MIKSRWLLVAVMGLPLLGCSKDTAKSTAAVQLPPLAIAANRPALEVIAGDGQLGAADYGETRQCTFTLRNNATQTMQLSVANKSCTCSGLKLEPESIEPGQTCQVTLLWTPKVEVIDTMTTRLWTELRDQAGTHHIRLEATGLLEPKVRFAFPRGPLDFGRLDLAELDNPSKALVVEAYSLRDAFQIESLVANLDGVQLVGTPQPLSADRIAQLQAKSGYRITVKPTRGLPTGRFLGQVQLVTSLSPVPLHVPVSGSLETGVVSLSHERMELPPRLQLRDGYRVPPITLTIRHGTCSSCEVEAITPALFQHKVTKLDEKTWRIELTLPPGRKSIQTALTPEQWKEMLTYGFEQGLLTLKLDHPEVKLVQVPLSGALLVH
jgi:hypothetical protein